MNKKGLGIIAVIAAVLGLGFIWYNHAIYSGEYVPAEDEIALHIQLDTEEDVGLLVFDYQVGTHEYSGGISNADKSPLKRDEQLIEVWNQETLRCPADTAELSIQFRIITEYVEPNFENIYPEDITKYVEPPVLWEARFGESYLITITGSQSNGYKAVLNE